MRITLLAAVASVVVPTLPFAQSTGGLPALKEELAAEVNRATSAENAIIQTVLALRARVEALEGNASAQQATIAALQADLASANATIAVLQGNVASLSSGLALVEASSVMSLAPYLEVTTSGTPKALLTGINLQIVNGMGQTATKNGAGNLIVGYDEFRGVPPEWVCAPPWDPYGAGSVCPGEEKSGSHYVVVGPRHIYSSYGGLVVGSDNAASGQFASAVGGSGNRAVGGYSLTAGGQGGAVGAVPPGNVGTGWYAVAVGGSNNVAGASFSVVAGGDGNNTIQKLDNPETLMSVFGGQGNTASGHLATVCGGSANVAAGSGSAVVGGMNNVAGVGISTVTGGVNNTATVVGSSILGANNPNP